MKISKIIRDLQEVQKKYGDIDVVVEVFESTRSAIGDPENGEHVIKPAVVGDVEHRPHNGPTRDLKKSVIIGI